MKRRLGGLEHSLTWVTDIMLMPPELEDMRRDASSFVSCPLSGDGVAINGAVFVDGPAFQEQWRLLRVSAAAVVIPSVPSKACVLPGNDRTSQRAELCAAVWVLKMSRGPVLLLVIVCLLLTGLQPSRLLGIRLQT